MRKVPRKMKSGTISIINFDVFRKQKQISRPATKMGYRNQPNKKKNNNKKTD